MSVKPSRSGSLSEKRLNGIFWKSFVDFVNKDDGEIPESTDKSTLHVDGESTRISKREGSFEYMELTAKDNVSAQSESDSSSSTENSSSESSKDDRSTSMYAVLDLHRKKEIHINDEIAIFDGSPIRRHSFTVALTSIPDSPKCSPIMHLGKLEQEGFVPSPIHSNNREKTKTLNCIDKDEAIFSDLDELPYEGHYDSDLEQSRTASLSPDTVPWKEQCLSIQRWMMPSMATETEDDEFIAIPDIVPSQDFDYCHYVPTLEVILEENEEGDDESFEELQLQFPKLNFLDNADLLGSQALSDEIGWQSINDLSEYSGQSQDDLFSTTSTCGSLGSMRKMSTLENLSFDDVVDDFSEGSSDEFDRLQANDDAHNMSNDGVGESERDETIRELSRDLFPEEEVDADTRIEGNEDNNQMPAVHRFEVTILDYDTSPNSSLEALKSSREVIPSLSISSESEAGSFTEEKEHCPSSQNSPKQSRLERNPSPNPEESISPCDASSHDSLYDVRSEPVVTTTSSEHHEDADSDSKSEIDISEIPTDLNFEGKDIPEIVVMFAQQELAKQNSMAAINQDDANGSVVQYRKRSATYDPDFQHDSAYSSHEAIHSRIQQIKANDSSRLSAMSSSTPELSVMTEDALPYIPVSYAREAAEIKRKRKRRATISATEAASRRNAASIASNTKALISGTGLGSSFSTLKRKLIGKSTGNGVKRSQSERQSVYYSSPDVSNPVSRLRESPRSTPTSEPESPPKAENRRRRLRSVVTSIIRRISSRFSSSNSSSPRVVKRRNDVSENTSPMKSNLIVIREENGDSVSIVSSKGHASVITSSTNHSEGATKRLNSDKAPPSVSDNVLEDFRQRSYSVPLRPRSNPSPRKPESIDSNVFERPTSAEESLDKTIYV